MGKIEYMKIKKAERDEMDKKLSSTLLELPKKEDVTKLVMGMLTPSERIMFSRRIQIAQHLLVGRSHYKIRDTLGVGFDTIQMVHEWLEDHFEDYKSTLPPLIKKKTKKNKRRYLIPPDPYSLRDLRSRYPGHFGLLNLLLGDPEVYEVEE